MKYEGKHPWASNVIEPVSDSTSSKYQPLKASVVCLLPGIEEELYTAVHNPNDFVHSTTYEYFTQLWYSFDLH